ncbi:MAG: hypothetical protein WCO96_07930 [Actinomycetes bacterium]
MTDRAAGDHEGMARALTARSDRFAADARIDEVSVDGRFVLAYQCALDLMNATLALVDPQATRRRGTHAKRIEACSASLPGSAELFRRIDLSRQARNLVVYSGHGTQAAVLERLLDDIASLRTLVRDLSEGRTA